VPLRVLPDFRSYAVGVTLATPEPYVRPLLNVYGNGCPRSFESAIAETVRLPGQVNVTTFADLPVSFPRVIETARETSASPFGNDLPFFTSPIFTGVVFGERTVTCDFAEDFVVLGVEPAYAAPTDNDRTTIAVETLARDTRERLDRGTTHLFHRERDRRGPATATTVTRPPSNRNQGLSPACGPQPVKRG